MSTVEVESLADSWKDEWTDQLCRAFLSLKTVDEMYCFLEDVATIGEICALAQRLEVARLLNEGCTYPEIARQTTEGKKKVSTATISRVKKFREYGADGYKIVLDRLKMTEESEMGRVSFSGPFPIQTNRPDSGHMSRIGQDPHFGLLAKQRPLP